MALIHLFNQIDGVLSRGALVRFKCLMALFWSYVDWGFFSHGALFTWGFLPMGLLHWGLCQELGKFICTKDSNTGLDEYFLKSINAKAKKDLFKSYNIQTE